MIMRRTLLSWFAVTALSAIASAGPSAELYPPRPTTIVVPFPAGGQTDTIARIVSEQMSVFLAQPLVIENVTGAGGTIGAGRLHAMPRLPGRACAEWSDLKSAI